MKKDVCTTLPACLKTGNFGGLLRQGFLLFLTPKLQSLRGFIFITYSFFNRADVFQSILFSLLIFLLQEGLQLGLSWWFNGEKRNLISYTYLSPDLQSLEVLPPSSTCRKSSPVGMPNDASQDSRMCRERRSQRWQSCGCVLYADDMDEKKDKTIL